MPESTEQTVLLVVCVVEARGFPVRPDGLLVVEGRMGGEVLATDPVALQGQRQEVNTELAWETTRRALQQHRLQRTPIKLQCYVVDKSANTRQLVGYVLLDLRAARLGASQKAHWYGLLGSQSVTPRPELLVSLSVEEDTQQPCKEDNAPNQLYLMLDAEGGCYTLGAPSPHRHTYTLSLTLDNPRHLPQPPSADKQLYFYYCLLGNDITSEPFSPPSFHPERASIRVCAQRETLGLFLAAQDELQLHLCSGDQSLCHGHLSLKPLAAENHFAQTLELTAELHSPSAPAPTVHVEVQLDVSPFPLPLHTTPYSAQPLSLSPQSMTMHRGGEPSAMTMHRGGEPSAMTVQGGGEPSAKRNLRQSFDEATLPSPPSLPPSSSHPPPSLPSLSPSSSHPPPSLPPSSSHPPLSLPLSSSHPPPSLPPSSLPLSSSHPPPLPPSSLPSSSSHPPTSIPSSHPPPLSLPSSSHPSLSFHHPPMSTATMGAARHYRCSLDLRRLHNVQLGEALNCYLRYSYPFFGSSYPVLVQPPVQVAPNTEATFTQGYCAFDFATTPQHLQTQFCSVPLIVEVWQTQDQLVGVAKVPLSEVFACEKQLMGNIVRQVSFLHVPITPPHTSLNPRTVTGYLQLVLVLEDHGTVRLTSGCEGEREEVKGASGQEYEAALELEMWKLAEEEAFQESLRGREEAHMSCLGREWEKREEQRQQLLKQKLERYSELEQELQRGLREVQQQQRQIKEKETELSLECEAMRREREEIERETKWRTQQLQTEYEQRLELERLKSEELQAQVTRLNKQVCELEGRCQSREAEFESYCRQLQSKPESCLQAEISMLSLEKVELGRKLDAAVRSKQHYKEQWSKALQELAAARQREQAAAREQLRRQQHELEVMRTRYLQQEGHVSLRKELEEVRGEVERLQEQTVSSVKPASTSPPHPLPPHTPEDKEVDVNVARWIEERDILLQTGVYTSSDPTIQRLDQRIREKLAERTQ